jgi:signal transduction histidine kinase
MDFEDSSQNRAERLIASLRLLAGFAFLLFVELEPSALPARNAERAMPLLAVYLLFSLLLAVLFRGSAAIRPRWRAAVQVLDLVTFTALCFLAGAPAGASLVFFAFILLAGALRWRWRGIAWTALAGIGMLLGAGLLTSLLSPGSPLAFDRMLVWSAGLAVLALLLASVSAHQQRLGREILGIASWPQLSQKDREGLLSHLLDHAAGILEAPRLLLVWEEMDEPWLHLALRSGGSLERLREAPTAFPLLVAEPLGEVSFFTQGTRGRKPPWYWLRWLRPRNPTEPVPPPAVWYRSAEGLSLWRGAPVGAELCRRFAIDRVASWPLRAERVEGRLFVLDKKDFEKDHLLLGEIVARRIAAELDQFYITQQLRSGAVTEERIRLAWDLHDGMLQSLTGAALQLQALARLLDEDPVAARAQLVEIQRLIAADQRDLRFFIEELKPASPQALAEETDFDVRFKELAERLHRLCGLDVELRLTGIDGRLPAYLARQLYRLLREALFNVARHAGASAARVEIALAGQALAVTVTDNGRGFPFKGRYEHEELRRQKLGPVSLKERITALGGSLAIDSGDGRTRIEMSLPVPAGVR